MRSTGTGNKREAEQRRRDIMGPFTAKDEIDVLRNVSARITGRQAEIEAHENARHPPLALQDAWKTFLASPDRPDSGENTLKHYDSQLRRFAKWITASHPELIRNRETRPAQSSNKTIKVRIVPMRDITEAFAREYATDLNDGRTSPSTFNQHIGFFKLLWKTLEDDIKGDTNPWTKIKRKKRTGARSRRELTVAELKRVCMNAEGELRLLFAVGIYTGLRLGDCATLRRGEVDLKRAVITRIPMKTSRRKPEPITVPVHPSLHVMLSEAMNGRHSEYVMPAMAAYYVEEKSYALSKTIQRHYIDNGIVIHKPGTGKYKDEDGNTVDTGKRAIVDVGFHSLRHTFVSLCREANAPLAVVEAIVGHSNPAMTRHYTHVGDAAAGAAVAALPSVTGEVLEPTAVPDSHMIDTASVRALAEKLTAKNVATIKKELMDLVDG